MPWNYRQYGSATDPIHKSHLNAIVGEYGCPKQFRYAQDARVDGGDAAADERETISGRAAAGTAAHETIARALGNMDMRAHLLRGGTIARQRVDFAFCEELKREIGARTVQWYGKDEDNADAVVHDRVTMIHGLLNDLHKHVHSIELIEPGFIARHGGFWLSGHIDLVYRPVSDPAALALADWKTGKVKPSTIDLDHGFEAGVYSTAVRQGYFLPREQIQIITVADGGGTAATIGSHTAQHASRYIAERNALEAALIALAHRLDPMSDADISGLDPMLQLISGLDVRTLGSFPSEIYCVHLGDYVPYGKSGTKAVKRAEDIKWHGYETAQKAHRYMAGDLRGPAWLPVQLHEYDLPRLGARLKNIVGMIRMGRFIDQVGDRCQHCSYRSDCLTAGYAPVGGERKQLERSLRMVPGGDDVADALSLDD